MVCINTKVKIGIDNAVGKIYNFVIKQKERTMKELNKKLNQVTIKLVAIALLLAIGFLLFLFGIGDIDVFVKSNEDLSSLYYRYYGVAYLGYGSLLLPFFIGLLMMVLGTNKMILTIKERNELVKEIEAATPAKEDKEEPAKEEIAEE